MITLATTNTIQGVAGTATAITYTLFGCELVGTSETYKVLAQGQLGTSAGALYTVPASTTTFIKRIEITNVTGADVTGISIYVNGTADANKIKSNFTLKANYSLVFDGNGWQVYDDLGSTVTLTGIRAAGSDTQIQFNDGGIANGGDADFTWDKTTNTLTLGGTDTDIILKGTTAEPASPSVGTLAVYAKAVSGRMMLKIKGPQGLDNPLQHSFAQLHAARWTAGVGTSGSTEGTIMTFSGTQSSGLPTTTNAFTMMRRVTFASVVTTTNQQVGLRTEALFYRGNATGIGGFFFACRMGFASIKTGCRAFVGLCAGTTAVVTVEPSNLTNMLGFGFNSTDTEWTFMHNDAAGTCTKDTIPGQGTLATNNTSYDFYIYCAPNDSTVYYRMDQTNTGTPVTLIDTSITTNLPVNTTALVAQCIMSNGTANIVVGDATLACNKIYVETDR